MSKNIKLLYVLVCVLLTGYICSLSVMKGLAEWYNDAPKPTITPPAFIFSAAWSLIYALLIASTYIVLSKAKENLFFKANFLFITQLIFQVFWCLTFFALGEIQLGLFAFIFLDITVFFMAKAYKKVSKLAFYILFPYFIWLAFATVLNALFWFQYLPS